MREERKDVSDEEGSSRVHTVFTPFILKVMLPMCLQGVDKRNNGHLRRLAKA